MAAELSSSTLLAVPLAPLAGAIIAGFFGRYVGRRGSHAFTILGVLISFILSAMVLKSVALDGARFNQTIYEWMVIGGLRMEVGFMVDGLSHDDVRGDLRVAHGAHLHHRLHGR